MAWSWSHAAEAYADAQSQVESKSREWLETVFAEWHATDEVDDFSPEFNEEEYQTALLEARTLPQDSLADFIWNRMSEFATCDNGGFDAWACPSGCHTVPFAPVCD